MVCAARWRLPRLGAVSARTSSYSRWRQTPHHAPVVPVGTGTLTSPMRAEQASFAAGGSNGNVPYEYRTRWYFLSGVGGRRHVLSESSNGSTKSRANPPPVSTHPLATFPSGSTSSHTV